MNEKPTDESNEAGLHEFVDAEFVVEGLDSPTREKALQDALGKLEGVENLSIWHGKVTVHYEPVLLSRKQLEEAIRQAGFQISEAHSTAASALTDALAEETKPPAT